MELRKHAIRAPTPFDCAEGNMAWGDSASPGPALRSQRPQTRLDTFCTRTGRPPQCPAKWGPAGEGQGQTTRMHVGEESHWGVVPMSHSNNNGRSWAEKGEGRPWNEENTCPSYTPSTQSEARVSQGLAGVRKIAKVDQKMKFTALLHHLTVDLLQESFYALSGKRHLGWTARRGRSMRPGWKVD